MSRTGFAAIIPHEAEYCGSTMLTILRTILSKAEGLQSTSRFIANAKKNKSGAFPEGKDLAQTTLVVDDDQDMVYIITEFLKMHGYNVQAASNGERALELIRDNAPDLVIADLTMPKMSGWYFTQKVREDKKHAKIPIIVLSGLLEDAEPETFEAANLYMGKPFDVLKLLEKVQALLKKAG